MLDPDVLDMLQGPIRTVYSIELLNFLRSNPNRPWKKDELVRELRTSSTVISETTARFIAVGLISSRDEEAIVYAPASIELDEVCARLLQAYRERPVTVISAMLASTDQKLRTFADAFRLKGRDE